VVRKRFPWLFRIRTALRLPLRAASLGLPARPVNDRQNLVARENGAGLGGAVPPGEICAPAHESLRDNLKVGCSDSVNNNEDDNNRSCETAV
jgi:hypothetical protein